MHTNASKTPAPLTLAAWQALPPAAAAREIHTRLAALPPSLRQAAVAWAQPEGELVVPLARAKDGQSSAASPSALSGVPYALKDLFDVAGLPTKAGSTFLDQVRPTPPRSSRIVERLTELGAVCAAKTHLVEFASGLTGENPHYGDCPHPLFPDRLSGGSSSGSAALVAAGVVPLAIGTDTGGSVRVPAAFCGLYGFRLTPGDEFIRDAFPLAPTMDTAGWFTHSAADMLTVWQALVGGTAPEKKLRGRYLPMASLLTTADPETAQACDQAAATWCPVADEATQQLLTQSWQDPTSAYASVGLSEAYQIHRNWLAPFREHYDPVIWQRFTDAGHFTPERIAGARAVFARVRAAWQQYFAHHDFLILPATPCPAPRKVDCTPELRRDILTLTAPVSFGGLPVLSLPVTLPGGLTGGLQVVLPAAHSAVVPWMLARSSSAR